MYNKIKNAMITIKKSKSLNNIIKIIIQINNRQYKKYINKKIKIKFRSTKKQFKKNSIKFNIIKIKKLKIKIYYIYEKKKIYKKLFIKNKLK